MKSLLHCCSVALACGKSSVFPSDYNPQRGVVAEIGCTAIAVDGGASVDGSAMAGMNVDCAQCDNRVTYIPSKTFASSTNGVSHQRPVYTNSGAYPRLITKGRASVYEPENNPSGFDIFSPIGYIDQPAMRTYGYWESTLPLMNEAGVSIGESSCGTRLIGLDTAILDMTELVRIAAERCATALCAVETIGALSERYGFMTMKNEITTGSEADGLPAFDDAGEAIVFADSTGEAWVLHITGGYVGVSNSTWAAQRVPKGHAVVLANTFIIKELPIEPNADFKFNKKIREIATAAGIWDSSSGESFNFSKIFGMDTTTFQRKPDELPIPLYTSLRTWRVFDILAPSKKFPVLVDNNDYPFSVEPERPVSHRDLMNLFSDYYAGTEFDMREGIMAGPFGAPYRLEGGDAKNFAQNPRAISIPRTSYSVVGVSRSDDSSVAWYAMDQPMTSVYVPLLARVKSESGLDQSYMRGSLWEFDRSSAFWAFDFVSNWMNMNWRNMSTEEVFPLRTKLQDWADEQVVNMMTDEREDNQQSLAKGQRNIQKAIVTQWWELADRLIVKYNDGYYTRVGPDVANPVVGKSYGYPGWYQAMVGMTADVHPVWVQPMKGGAGRMDDFNANPQRGAQKEYAVPVAFNYTDKTWVWDNSIESVPVAGSNNFIGNRNVWWCTAAAFSLLAGIIIGKYVLPNNGQKPMSIEKLGRQQPLLA